VRPGRRPPGRIFTVSRIAPEPWPCCPGDLSQWRQLAGEREDLVSGRVPPYRRRSRRPATPTGCNVVRLAPDRPGVSRTRATADGEGQDRKPLSRPGKPARQPSAPERTPPAGGKNNPLDNDAQTVAPLPRQKSPAGLATRPPRLAAGRPRAEQTRDPTRRRRDETRRRFALIPGHAKTARRRGTPGGNPPEPGFPPVSPAPPSRPHPPP
jgi:hypothetical protein